MHAGCESLFTEDDVEQAADEGFDCVSCQPYVVKPAGECQVLGRGAKSSGQGCLALGQGLKRPWFACLFHSACCPPRVGAYEGERAR